MSTRQIGAPIEGGFAQGSRFLGSHRSVTGTGTIAAGIASASSVLSMRWGSATAIAIIDEVELVYLGSLATAFAAGGSVQVVLTTANAWTASDSGGTDLSGAGNFGTAYLDSLHAATAFTDIRVATTGALTAGTRTALTNVGSSRSIAPATPATYETYAKNVMLFDSTRRSRPGQIVLRQNTGIMVRAYVEATGTWACNVAVAWREYAL